jgi:hypothetical protein
MPSSTQSEPSVDSLPANLLVEVPTVRPADLKNDGYSDGLSSVFLIIFCIGVFATLAWQSYGDPVREMIAGSYPQLSWLAPRAEPIPQNVPDVIELASRTASPPDQQQSNAISLDLDALRQDLDRIAASQEQMMRSLDQLTADQEQMTREITKLEEIEQSNSSRNSELARPVFASAPQPTPRPASAPAAKPLRRPVSASKPKPISRASPGPTAP